MPPVSRNLRRDLEEVLALTRCGGSIVQRDGETLIASGCAQVTGEQLMLLKRMHPRVHFWLMPSVAPSPPGVSVLANFIPSTPLLFSGECLQILVALSLYITTWLYAGTEESAAYSTPD